MAEMVAIWRLATVLDVTGQTRSTLYRLISAGSFPKPVKIGPRACGWPSDEVEEWIRRKIAKGREAA